MKNSQFKLDDELVPVFTAIAEQSKNIPVPQKGDWQTLRAMGNAAMDAWNSLMPSYDNVEKTTYFCTSYDDANIELRWYTKKNADSQAAVIYIHGGGMILGDINRYNKVVSNYVSQTAISFLSVEYRLAPEAKDETPAQDVFAALNWLRTNAEKLNIDINRIAIMGDSAGGGIAAGAAILARDNNVPLKQQILIYPMLDDRNLFANPLLQSFATWTYENNYTGWHALLNDKIGTDEVSAISAPARLQNYEALAPAYIEVGNLDIFRDEDICYAQQLLLAGVPVELHVLKGVPHGFERIAPDISISKHAFENRFRAIKSL